MANINELARQLGDSDAVKRYQAKQALRQIAWQSGKNEQERQAVAKALVEEYGAKEGEQPRHSADVRNELAENLSLVAGDAEVPALKQALEDADLREMARYCLDRMQSPAATAALVEETKHNHGVEFQIGVVNALGDREGPEVLAALHEAAKNQEPEVRLAALEALACQGDPEADKLFAEANGQLGEPRRQARLVKARLCLADKLAANDNDEAANKIRQAISESNADEPQKNAAKRALAPAPAQ